MLKERNKCCSGQLFYINDNTSCVHRISTMVCTYNILLLYLLFYVCYLKNENMYEPAAAEYIIDPTFEHDEQALQEGIVPDIENYAATTHKENDKVGTSPCQK
jgi:hypothetical protein